MNQSSRNRFRPCRRLCQPSRVPFWAFIVISTLGPVDAYTASFSPHAWSGRRRLLSRRQAVNKDESVQNWNELNRNYNEENENEEDWQKVLLQKQDGSFWSAFEPMSENANITNIMDSSVNSTSQLPVDDEAAAEIWLDQLQSLASVEVEFNLQEADRADKARQMEEWGFDRETIRNALGVAVDSSLETIDEVRGMQKYREQSFWDDVDLTTVESHTQVEKDEETGEPERLKMVYVDEHTCIGCTNCAMIAQSTFFMHPDHGRARVFQQWGDDDETIQIAIETCPVDCIHYIPYGELVSLEIDRRNQNINFKARLVSQAENGNSLSHLTGRGSNAFTAPQVISGNMGIRCSNCPTRGCRTCPMYGVGQNPAYEAAEKARKEKRMKRLLQQQRERDQKTAEL
jgi:ferredoxin